MTLAELVVARRIATALLNARRGRRGVRARDDILDLVDAPVRDDALDDARAVMVVLANGTRDPSATP